MDSVQVKIESLKQGYIEILPDGKIYVHLFDTLDFAYDGDKNIKFEKIVEHPIDPNYGIQDEADICSLYTLSKEDFLKELGTLNITKLCVNGELVDKNKLVLT
jgi:hypothetical protein